MEPAISSKKSWAAWYALPVVAALIVSIGLQREHANLEVLLARLKASALKAELELEENTTQRQKLEQARGAFAAGQKQRLSNLSPWQKWRVGVTEAALRLAAKGGSKARGEIPLMDRSAYLPQLLDDPVYRDAVAALQKQQVEGKYGRLFAALNLGQADQDQLESLLAQKEMAWADAKALVLNGSNQPASSPEVQAAAKAAAADTMRAIDGEIRQEFGSDVANDISSYDGVAQFYQTMDTLGNTLSGTDTPLLSDQADQLVKLLADALGSKVFTSYWSIPDSVIEQAKSFLSPSQIAALVQLQQYQVQRINARNSLLAPGRH